MIYKFLNIDVKAILFDGFSTPGMRAAAALVSILLLFFMDYMIFRLITLFSGNQIADLIAVLFLIFFVLHYLHTNTILLKTWAIKTVELTPFMTMYRSDKLILKKAVDEIIRVSDTIAFEGCEDYQEINRTISLKTNQKVIEHINNGTFRKWIEVPGNLKSVADLIYQCHLAEKTMLMGKDSVS